MVWIAVAICLLAPMGALHAAGKGRARAEALWDSQRYISVDEVKPGMPGYCLTEYGEAGIEKFELKVVNVIHEFEPGRNAILVTALNPVIGYLKGAEVAKEAMASNRTIKDVAVEKGYLTEEEAGRILDARRMTEGGIQK